MSSPTPSRSALVGLPPPAEAWDPLPDSDWNRAAAAHLLRRTGWTALPEEIDRAVGDGLPRTLARLFPKTPPAFAAPPAIVALEADTVALARELKDATGVTKQKLQREARERSIAAIQDLSLQWMQTALDPDRAAFEKWLLFLSDIYVVSHEKVRNAAWIHSHHDILRRHAVGAAPALTKAVSRSPAMIVYLDLQNSRRGAPNENFARELFELFVLGEGHYTENDVKEAARAFTGYRHTFGRFRFARAQHDAGHKTVFGRTGAFDGDAVIDLAYTQPAAAEFLPAEWTRFYLTSEGLPRDYFEPLGTWWRNHGFDLRALAHRVFGSRLFHHSSFRGNYIKSPLQFHLGLLRDLGLDVVPVARLNLNAHRQMGQVLFNPPNVRGWVGGRHWINATTLSSRRQLVQRTLAGLDERLLNADEAREVAAARDRGYTRFSIDSARWQSLAALSPDEAAAQLLDLFLPQRDVSALRPALAAYLSESKPAKLSREDRLEAAVSALLESPTYHLC